MEQSGVIGRARDTECRLRRSLKVTAYAVREPKGSEKNACPQSGLRITLYANAKKKLLRISASFCAAVSMARATPARPPMTK